MILCFILLLNLTPTAQNIKLLRVPLISYVPLLCLWYSRGSFCLESGFTLVCVCVCVCVCVFKIFTKCNVGNKTMSSLTQVYIPVIETGQVTAKDGAVSTGWQGCGRELREPRQKTPYLGLLGARGRVGVGRSLCTREWKLGLQRVTPRIEQATCTMAWGF